MNLYLLPMLLAENSHEKALTPYSIEVIKGLKVFFAENIKTTRRFISSLKSGIVIDNLEIIEINKDTPFEVIFNHLLQLKSDIGIISEAGSAGVADPGALVVEAGHQLGYTIRPLVSPSSILLALMGSGFNGQSFAFHGYLPIKENERAQKLKQLEREATRLNQTQIFMETPYRNNQLLKTILDSLHPNTKLCIACNLTAEDEYIKTQSIASWKKKNLPDIHKKPTIFLING